MSLLRRITNLFHRSKLDQEIEAELRSHIEMRTTDNIAAGMSPEEARRDALLRFGNRAVLKERVTATDAQVFLDSLWQDLCYGLRMLRRNPGFATMAILALGLGIGSATVIFSTIYGVVFDTFPYKNFGDVAIFEVNDSTQAAGRGYMAMSLADFADYRTENQVFEDMVCGWGGLGLTDVAYRSESESVDYSVYYVSANLFEFMGVTPLLGRWSTPEDTKPGATPVFVMSYKLWREQFNRNPAIIGRAFPLNGVSRTLVGVMPPRFRWGDSDIWIPFSIQRNQLSTNAIPADANVWPIGRLKRGVSLKEAAANLNLVAHEIAKNRPDEFPKRFYVTTMSFQADVVGPFKKTILPLAGAVVLLLLISSSNVVGMLLARAAVREREVAVRVSLGASRSRLLRQHMVESLLLAAPACLAGCLLAWIGIRKIIPLVPSDVFPAEAVIQLNSIVLLFAVGTAFFVTLVCGAVPAIHATRGAFAARLAGMGRGGKLTFQRRKLLGSLVVLEVALSIVLLIGAGLMMRTFLALVDVKLGFDPGRILVGQLILPSGSYESTQEKNSFLASVLDRINRVPGVVASTISISTPPKSDVISRLTVPGEVHAEAWKASVDLCGEGYFRTLGLLALRGRLFSTSDIAFARKVSVINHSLAQRYFAGHNPIGTKIKFDSLEAVPGMRGAYFEVVGVVPDVTNQGVRNPAMPEAYIPYTLFSAGPRSIIVRSAVDPNSIIGAVRRQIWAVDPDVTLSNAETIEAYLRQHNYAAPKFGVTLLGAFGSIGLALMAIGLFGVMSYTVAVQTHEIAIRVALGAQRDRIIGMVLGRGLGLVTGGVLIGTVASSELTQFIKSQLWGVSALDVWTFGFAGAVIVTVGVFACLAPMYRAMRVDPMTALRHE